MLTISVPQKLDMSIKGSTENQKVFPFLSVLLNYYKLKYYKYYRLKTPNFISSRKNVNNFCITEIRYVYQRKYKKSKSFPFFIRTPKS